MSGVSLRKRPTTTSARAGGPRGHESPTEKDKGHNSDGPGKGHNGSPTKISADGTNALLGGGDENSARESPWRPRFLSSLGVLYFAAILSFYLQYPGLVGRHGLMPAETYFSNIKKRLGEIPHTEDTLTFIKAFSSLYLRLPVLSWANELGPRIDFDAFHELLCLLGLVFSALTALGWHNSFLFLLLWAIYLSLFHVGQTFMSFQWDILLLEVGFISIFYASFWGFSARQSNRVPIVWLLRWIFFKLMLMAGVVKVQAHCPTWLNLTALEYHFATQPLANPLSWYGHQVHPFFSRLSVAATLLIEIPCTLLLIMPIRRLRVLGACLQIQLQIMIILTGNYNFFNLLTMALNIPCLEDDGLSSALPDQSTTSALLSSTGLWTVTILLLSLCLSHMFVVYTHREEALEYLNIKTAFTVEQMQGCIDSSLPSIIWAFGLMLAAVSIYSIRREMLSSRGSVVFQYLKGLRAVSLGVLSLSLFVLSSVPLISISNSLRSTLPHHALEAYQAQAEKGLMITSGYGLFRRMTGVGKAEESGVKGWAGVEPSVVERPEIIIEGSLDGRKWTEIPFSYKPGDVYQAPKIVIPHQPRLDWQMWFAALGSAPHYPGWFIHLIDKILEDCQPVLSLLDTEQYPFKERPPRFVRASLYVYDFTRWDSAWARTVPNAEIIARNASLSSWWSRRKKGEFLPVIQRENPSVTQAIAQFGWHRPLNGCPRMTPEEYCSQFDWSEADSLSSVFSKESLSWAICQVGLGVRPNKDHELVVAALTAVLVFLSIYNSTRRSRAIEAI